MTTIKPALDAAARAAIAARTEALFRALRRVPRGPLPAQERPPRRRLRREVRGPVGPGRDERAVRVLGRGRPRPTTARRWSTSSPARRPAGSSSPSRPARQLGVAQHLRRGGPRRRRRDPPRVPARLPDRARRARPARRRHPHDRRLAAGDDPGRRGDGRRDRRVRRPRRPERRPDHADLPDDRAASTRSARSGSWTCRPTSRAPDTCPRCADGTPLHAPGQQRDRRLIAWIGGPGTLFAVVLVVVIALTGGAALSCSAVARRPGAERRRRTRRRRRASSIAVDAESARPTSAASTLRTTDGGDPRRSASPQLENGAAVPARAPRRAPGDARIAGPGLVPRRRPGRMLRDPCLEDAPSRLSRLA